MDTRRRAPQAEEGDQPARGVQPHRVHTGGSAATPEAAGDLSVTPLAGDLSTERHRLPVRVTPIVGLFVVVVVAACMIMVPGIRYRVFWYAISQKEIDLQNGIIFTTRSIVPLHRVHSLQTQRGPVADYFRMANLKIRTAAGSVSLSGLDRDEVDELCARISRLTDLADDV
jgi:membrane protein YdbS with pleckstrin-like domain